jgi:hypothetical protein
VLVDAMTTVAEAEALADWMSCTTNAACIPGTPPPRAARIGSPTWTGWPR